MKIFTLRYICGFLLESRPKQNIAFVKCVVSRSLLALSRERHTVTSTRSMRSLITTKRYERFVQKQIKKKMNIVLWFVYKREEYKNFIVI